MADDAKLETLHQRWAPADPARQLVGRGHPVGDFLEAHAWTIAEERPGYLRLDVHLPEQVKNPRGQLFGGFTPTYVDFVAIHTCRAGRRTQAPRSWFSTASLSVDYFAPVVGERFVIEGEVLHQSGRTRHVQVRFLDREGRLLALARATLLEAPRSPER